MIARPVTRPRPIPFAAPGPGAPSTRPVSWAGSSASLQAAAPKTASTTKVTAIVTARRSPVLVNSAATPTPPTATTAPATGQLSAKFMGQGALSVRSSVTGRHYRFQGHGDSLAIDKHDMLMLKRIPDLVVL